MYRSGEPLDISTLLTVRRVLYRASTHAPSVRNGRSDDEALRKYLTACDRAIHLAPRYHEGYVVKIRALLTVQRAADALTVADLAVAQCDVVTLRNLRAEVLLAMERVLDSRMYLQQTIADGRFSGDPRPAFRLALLLRDRLADTDECLEVTTIGLSLVPKWYEDRSHYQLSNYPGTCADYDIRAAHVALATLHLRCAASYWEGMSATRADQLPLSERLLVQAFGLAREPDRTQALAMYAHAFSRDPYHPIGLYDYAAVLALAGDRGTSHALSMFQCRPHYDPYSVYVPVRRDRLDEARAESLRLGDVDSLVRLVDAPGPDSDRPRDAPIEPPYLYYHMAGDRLYLPHGDLYRAFRRLAPMCLDAHFFVWNWNVGGYLDEITVRAGQLSVRRTITNYSDSPARLELLEERAHAAPGDDLLRAAVAG